MGDWIPIACGHAPDITECRACSCDASDDGTPQVWTDCLSCGGEGLSADGTLCLTCDAIGQVRAPEQGEAT